MHNNSQDNSAPPSINVVKEQVHIDKQVIEKGKVRIEKKVHQNEDTIHIPLINEEVQVQKVAVNQY